MPHKKFNCWVKTMWTAIYNNIMCFSPFVIGFSCQILYQCTMNFGLHGKHSEVGYFWCKLRERERELPTRLICQVFVVSMSPYDPRLKKITHCTQEKLVIETANASLKEVNEVNIIQQVIFQTEMECKDKDGIWHRILDVWKEMLGLIICIIAAISNIIICKKSMNLAEPDDMVFTGYQMSCLAPRLECTRAINRLMIGLMPGELKALELILIHSNLGN